MRMLDALLSALRGKPSEAETAVDVARVVVFGNEQDVANAAASRELARREREQAERDQQRVERDRRVIEATVMREGIWTSAPEREIGRLSRHRDGVGSRWAGFTD